MGGQISGYGMSHTVPGQQMQPSSFGSQPQQLHQQISSQQMPSHQHSMGGAPGLSLGSASIHQMRQQHFQQQQLLQQQQQQQQQGSFILIFFKYKARLNILPLYFIAQIQQQMMMGTPQQQQQQQPYIMSQRNIYQKQRNHLPR